MLLDLPSWSLRARLDCRRCRLTASIRLVAAAAVLTFGVMGPLGIATDITTAAPPQPPEPSADESQARSESIEALAERGKPAVAVITSTGRDGK